MTDDRPNMEELVDRFERVAQARAETGRLDAPAEELLPEAELPGIGSAPEPPGIEPPPESQAIEPTAAPAAAAPPPAPAAVSVPAEPMEVEDLATWWARGERVTVEVPGGRYSIFTRVVGDGPWLTCIHGFPTSSWDWAPMLPALASHFRVLTFDLLGFGDSDKPAGHDWSAFEQADIIEALWRHLEVRDTRVLAHDVGLTVSLELLARQEEGNLTARMSALTLLNGGAYAGFHRPRPIQVWLQRPVVGALIARMLSEQRFGPALAEVFGPAHQPSAEELHQHWLTVSRRDGGRNYHRLIKYIPERRAHAGRWESALEKTATPVRFVWGMADPVSGAHMAAVIRERRPSADIVELEGVGHYPQLEAPDRVAEAVLRDP